MFSPRLLQLAESVLAKARTAELRLATAESCTGGLIAACLTEIPGSSDVLERGFVTYSNEAKIEELGVSAALIEKYGAVSREVALAMAEGALVRSRAQLSISTTGIAGPGGGSAAKPVGLVFIGAARKGGQSMAAECRISDVGRHEIRMRSVEEALKTLQSLV